MLEHIGMIGVSWRHGGAESLAEFTLQSAELDERLVNFARTQGLVELAYLATCNRVELIFARAAGAPAGDLRREAFELLTGRPAGAGEAERRLRAWGGEGAAERLFLIAAGLDSAAVGEAEIVGQVKASYQRAAGLGLVGESLELLFGEALRIAARVRGGTQLGQGRVSLAEIAVQFVRDRLARTPGTVALVGVSPMTERAAVSLAAAGVRMLCVNRSLDKAEALASRFDARAMALETFCADPPPVEVVVCATGAPGAVLDAAALERVAAQTLSGQAPLVVDMAVPPDVAPETCRKLGVPRIGMDDITKRAEQNRAARLVEAAQAREQVDAALTELQERYAERYYGPLLGALQRRYRQTAREGVNRLLKKELKGLGDNERHALEVWAEVLARRFAHIPSLGLRGLMQSGPEGSIEAFLSGLEPEFADELRAALMPAMRPAEPDTSLEPRIREQS